MRRIEELVDFIDSYKMEDITETDYFIGLEPINGETAPSLSSYDITTGTVEPVDITTLSVE